MLKYLGLLKAPHKGPAGCLLDHQTLMQSSLAAACTEPLGHGSSISLVHPALPAAKSLPSHIGASNPLAHPCPTCVDRLGRQRDTGTVGFGNARAVRNFYEQSITRQSARVLSEKRQGSSPDLLLLTRDDLLGPKHLDVSRSKPLQQLQSLRGLQKVKDSVSTLLEVIKTNAELEEVEKPLKPVCLNRVFLGNPGTGATEQGQPKYSRVNQLISSDGCHY